jgi:hypothetical protein
MNFNSQYLLSFIRLYSRDKQNENFGNLEFLSIQFRLQNEDKNCHHIER